jgi:hypothetical protein
MIPTDSAESGTRRRLQDDSGERGSMRKGEGAPVEASATPSPPRVKKWAGW